VAWHDAVPGNSFDVDWAANAVIDAWIDAIGENAFVGCYVYVDTVFREVAGVAIRVFERLKVSESGIAIGGVEEAAAVVHAHSPLSASGGDFDLQL